MTAWGSPNWAGTKLVLDTTISIHASHGIWISSRKRAASHALSRSNPASDHNEANRSSYALDGATFNGRSLAYAIAKHFGIGNYRTGTFTNYYIRRGGATFRYQGLWAVAGHFNHHHSGLRLVSGTFKLKPRYPRTLKPGMRNETVKKMKNSLWQHGYRGHSSGNKYDKKKTVEVVKRFQRKNKLKADGIVGPATWKKLLQK